MSYLVESNENNELICDNNIGMLSTCVCKLAS